MNCAEKIKAKEIYSFPTREKTSFRSSVEALYSDGRDFTARSLNEKFKNGLFVVMRDDRIYYKPEAYLISPIPSWRISPDFARLVLGYNRTPVYQYHTATFDGKQSKELI